MKSRLTLIFAALVVMLGTMIWLVQDRHSLAAAVPLTAAADTAGPITPPVVQPVIQVEAAPLHTASAAVTPTTAPAVTTASADGGRPLVRVDADGTLKYVARPGDTVSQLAIALLGSDSKDHRDAIIAANESLEADPDRVLAGKTYAFARAGSKSDDAVVETKPMTEVAAALPVKTMTSPKSTADSSAVETPASDKPVADKIAADQSAAEPTVAVKSATDQPVTAAAPSAAETGPKLKYTAQPGDTVGVLAANLLGGDTKENRDLIVSSNASLQRDPNHLVAGESYTIVAANGLAASAAAAPMKLQSSQPDADDVARVAVGRTLRYTAQPGDTVTKLATVLLGSDTPVTRDLIIKANPSLKHDPDHLVAGKTYWIAAPTADAMP